VLPSLPKGIGSGLAVGPNAEARPKTLLKSAKALGSASQQDPTTLICLIFEITFDKPNL
jgi:hypothetical protein